MPILLEKKCGEFPKTDDIYEEIRNNCYRVLFSGFDAVQVSEYFLSENGKTVEKRLVDVEPFIKKKKIDKIWTLGCKSRKTLWFNCIGGCFSQGSREVFKASFEMFIPCLVLQIMIKQKLLNDLDIKAFLYTFDKLETGRRKIFEKNRNLRAINLASIFLRGIEMLDLLNQITGHPFKTHFFKLKNYFDGNVFQLMYEKVYSDDSEFHEKVNLITKILALTYLWFSIFKN